MATEPPKLPPHISANGREVWDWAHKFSEFVHRWDEMNRLALDIAKIGTRCGDCDYWMKSRDCPREHNVNGYTRGPSCEGIPCPKFKECRLTTARRAELKEKLAALVELEAAS